MPLLAPNDAIETTITSLTRQLLTVECQRDAVCRDLAAIMAELYKVKDENSEMQAFLASHSNAFQ